MNDVIVCKHCDLLLKRPALNHAESARCPRCKTVLRNRPRSSLTLSLSFALACVFLLICACYFPLLSIEKAGSGHSMYLYHTSHTFFEHGYMILFLIVSALLFIIPLLILAILIYLLFPLLILKKYSHYSLFFAKLLFHIKAWNMIDVFLIATLASLTKLMSIAHIEFGLGLWAYMLFAISLSAAISNLNSGCFWDYLEKVQCHQKIKLQHPKG